MNLYAKKETIGAPDPHQAVENCRRFSRNADVEVLFRFTAKEPGEVVIESNQHGMYSPVFWAAIGRVEPGKVEYIAVHEGIGKASVSIRSNGMMFSFRAVDVDDGRTLARRLADTFNRKTIIVFRAGSEPQQEAA